MDQPNRISSMQTLALCLLVSVTVLLSAGVTSSALYHSAGANYDYQPRQQQPVQRRTEQRASFAARRAADDSRPLTRVHLNLAASQVEPVVMGKLKAPAPERIATQRVPKQSNSGSQTVGASYRISDGSELPEKVVHGVIGGGSASAQSQRKAANSRIVSAKIMVSDEGLNYPPSKLSADINGNVAEIVTAPPEAVENDFLVPQSSRFFGARRSS